MVIRWPGTIDVPGSGRAEPAGLMNPIGGWLLIITHIGARPDTPELCKQQMLQPHPELGRDGREMDGKTCVTVRGVSHDLAVEVSRDHLAVAADELHPEIAERRDGMLAVYLRAFH